MAAAQVATMSYGQASHGFGHGAPCYTTSELQSTYASRLDAVVEAEHADEDFHVGVSMPNLARALPQLCRLPDALHAALPFLEGLDAPRRATPLLAPAAPGDARLTVVLDLDETLVHCRLEELPTPRANFCVTFEDCDALGFVYVRPHARLFLEVAARLFELVVFTASSQAYADQVLDKLDPDGRCLAGRLYRQHCTEAPGGFFKDLRCLGRPLERSVLVDNSPVSLLLCPDNGVLVSSWIAEGEEDDNELMELLLLLQECAQGPSAPAFLKERYGFREFLEELSDSPLRDAAEPGRH